MARKYLDGKDLVWAILKCEGEPSWHIDDITRWVVECGLSTVGAKAESPRQSVSPVLTLNSKRFRAFGGGHYGIVDDRLDEKDERVREAVARYETWRDGPRNVRASSEQRIEALESEVSRLRRENAKLLEKLRRIAEICID